MGGLKKKVLRSSGIRTHDHRSTSISPSPLSQPSSTLLVSVFANFIHVIMSPDPTFVTLTHAYNY